MFRLFILIKIIPSIASLKIFNLSDKNFYFILPHSNNFLLITLKYIINKIAIIDIIIIKDKGSTINKKIQTHITKPNSVIKTTNGIKHWYTKLLVNSIMFLVLSEEF